MITVVLKLGGEVVRGHDLAAIAHDVAAMTARDATQATRVIVAHGGGPQATELSKRLGIEPHIVAGRRVTDRETLDVMKMAVAGMVNVDLCAALGAAGARPIGLHGASDRLIAAKKRPARVYEGAGPEPIDLGHVGDVVAINVALLERLLGDGLVPVVACIGAGSDGAVYNINADIVGNRIAAALRARLVLVTDARGVLADIADPSSRFTTLAPSQAREAIERGAIRGGMIPKLTESFAALANGVESVHVVGKLAAGDLAREMASPGSVGTALVAG